MLRKCHFFLCPEIPGGPRLWIVTLLQKMLWRYPRGFMPGHVWACGIDAHVSGNQTRLAAADDATNVLDLEN